MSNEHRLPETPPPAPESRPGCLEIIVKITLGATIILCVLLALLYGTCALIFSRH